MPHCLERFVQLEPGDSLLLMSGAVCAVQVAVIAVGVPPATTTKQLGTVGRFTAIVVLINGSERFATVMCESITWLK